MIQTELKNIRLNALHNELGAKMVPFSGFLMPVRYTSDIEEHLTVREGVGVFDVSHMGEFLFEGEGAKDFLQRITTNNIEKLVPGKAQYSLMTNLSGGIIDDLLVYCLDQDKYMLVVNAGNIEKDWKWVENNLKGQCKAKNISSLMSLFAVQGPLAVNTLQKITTYDLSTIPYYSFKVAQIGDVDDVIISATGYTGAGGFELYVKNEQAEKLWESVFKAGKEFGIKPIGLGARDTLRLEMGFALYGNDISEKNNPLEAGLGWITHFEKDFIGKQALLNQKESGIERKLIGFELEERGIPRSLYPIQNQDGKLIGSVTSGTMSPCLGKGIGMGYVQKNYSKPGTDIQIEIRNKAVKAKIVNLPFIKS